MNINKCLLFSILTATILTFACSTNNNNVTKGKGEITLEHSLFRGNNRLDLYFYSGPYDLEELKEYSKQISTGEMGKYENIVSQFFNDRHYIDILKKNPDAPFEEIKTGKTIKAQLVRKKDDLQLFWYEKSAWESEATAIKLN